MQKNLVFSIFLFILLAIGVSNISIAFATENNSKVDVQKRNILLVFPQFENLSLTDRRVVAGIRLAYENNSFIKDKFSLVESNTAADTIALINNTLLDIEKYKPVLILGAVTSNIAFAISEVAESKKIPFISPFATNAKLTIGKEYTFTTCFDDDFQATVLANYVTKTAGGTGLALINQMSTYAIGFSETFSKAMARRGSSLSVIKFNSSDAISIAKLMPKQSSDFSFIFIPSYQVEAANILSQIYPLLSKKTLYFGGDSWGGGSVFHNAVKELGDEFRGYYVQHWSQESKSNENLRFLRLLEKVKIDGQIKGVTTAMNAPIAMGYDAALVGFEALKLNKNIGNLSKSIRKVSISGASGAIQYKHGVNTPNKPLYIYEINNKSEKFIKSISEPK